MSLATAIGGKSVTWKKSDTALVMEILAFAIHPGTSENTTTLCLFEDELLMTSQQNLRFDGIGPKEVKQKLLILTGLLNDASLSVDKKRDAWWAKECVISSQINQQTTAMGQKRSIGTIESANEKIQRLRDNLYKPMMNGFFGGDTKKYAELIKDLSQKIGGTRVVLNEDIFGKAPDTTGFHGESRILRHMFIRWATAYIPKNATSAQLAKDLQVSRGKPKSAPRLNLIKILEEAFVGETAKWGLVFGSSQGTCAGCARALDICGAARGAQGNPFKQWLDPLDLSGEQGSTKTPAVIRDHALNLVLSDFDMNFDAVEDAVMGDGDQAYEVTPPKYLRKGEA